jgi:hypothetical protein
MTETAPWLNLLLSGPNPGRWKLVRESVQHALPKEEGVDLYVSPSERAAARAFFDPERFAVAEWEVSDGRILFSEPLSTERANLLLYGLPAFADDLLEALVDGFRAGGFEMGRIATHVHCGWCARREEARGWFDAAIHFSDLVLLDNRDEAGDPWVRRFQERYRKLRYPCHFDLVRKALPKHPHWLFDSQPRRLSLVFDPDDLSGLGPSFPGAEDDGDEDEERPEGDPYLRRNAAGERERIVRPLPFAEGEGEAGGLSSDARGVDFPGGTPPADEDRPEA